MHGQVYGKQTCCTPSCCAGNQSCLPLSLQGLLLLLVLPQLQPVAITVPLDNQLQLMLQACLICVR
jgi:hypothetical protein